MFNGMFCVQAVGNLHDEKKVKVSLSLSLCGSDKLRKGSVGLLTFLSHFRVDLSCFGKSRKTVLCPKSHPTLRVLIYICSVFIYIYILR